jgi:DNA-binding transcriptional LysR family regulator
MADLNSIVVFAKVVEAKSFSEAARRLKMPTSSVSRHVSELERRLGIRLLERSTRHLRLTELGAEIFEYAKRSVELSDAYREFSLKPSRGSRGGPATFSAAEHH